MDNPDIIESMKDEILSIANKKGGYVMKFNRGYKESREKVKKSAKFTRSCFNCDFYFKTMSDKEEVCQNRMSHSLTL